jgi:hypothetical protein
VSKVERTILIAIEHVPLIPAHAGIQIFLSLALDPRFRGDERNGADSIASERALEAGAAVVH